MRSSMFHSTRLTRQSCKVRKNVPVPVADTDCAVRKSIWPIYYTRAAIPHMTKSLFT